MKTLKTNCRESKVEPLLAMPPFNQGATPRTNLHISQGEDKYISLGEDIKVRNWDVDHILSPANKAKPQGLPRLQVKDLIHPTI